MDRNEHHGPIDPADLKIEALLRLDAELHRSETPRDLSHRLAVTAWAERATPAEPLQFASAASVPGGSRVFRNTWWSRIAMAAALGLACVVVLRPATQQKVGPESAGETYVLAVDKDSAGFTPYLTNANADAAEVVEPVINTYARAGEDLDVLSSELSMLAMDLDL
ncbi:MAG: hypothetical protein KC983_11935 [Phycisphaerales bacterium]|nr:hypothetical protein [Phycisphaerales bacterium]